ncbi:hypothetical protein H6G54_21175 [Anabaena cylindrica FACHB-243]|uniref:Uncharacterized protein n=1 Tax=Anabaena cylindrica (strain ATCC 27899 / PCC 7122) TaxID=272123 RepID=K9ZQ28_ANACC|nr:MULTISPECIES: hypothetical protein [Anabaena]AFZ61323.1 hypothetical protein Anacy_6046 [Anabaena cylindrica PCC 7122]MBD2420169.1 hypothetical protein [Anabaena cylindrica FACHB-243]MBY5282204.1 hypothetical protein [Anabaena sp. CCAP 1446/1C]MBY5309439.1 hypothetical protein [Anabaena sp. CCAP 1446/1C]MCM2409264.1 hypothetical protein [Anabaena sp. CCAP 1446/1C]
MENERAIYETVTGARVNDVHWWRVKRDMRTAELPLTKDGFELFIALRKTSPRYFSQYHKIKGKISKVESSIGDGCTGQQFINLLEKLGITPNKGTISRWFKTAGGFKAKSFYAKQVLIPICAVALIYKSKVQSSQLSKIGA